jgi:hypothetical protein
VTTLLKNGNNDFGVKKENMPKHQFMVSTKKDKVLLNSIDILDGMCWQIG